jgi:hypothetical protein
MLLPKCDNLGQPFDPGRYARFESARLRGSSTSQSFPSALITDGGRRVLLRLQGRCYDLSYQELRGLLGPPEGSPGLGISIDGDVLQFEFPADQQAVEVTAGQLSRRLARQTTSGA